MQSEKRRKFVMWALASIAFLLLIMVNTIFYRMTLEEYRVSTTDLREQNRSLEEKITARLARIEKIQALLNDEQKNLIAETNRLKTEIRYRLDNSGKSVVREIRASRKDIKRAIGRERTELVLLIKSTNQKIAGNEGDVALIRQSVKNVENLVNSIAANSQEREQKIITLLVEQVHHELSQYKGRNYNTVFNNILAGLMNKYRKRYPQALSNLRAAMDINTSITSWTWKFIVPVKDYDRDLDKFIKGLIEDVNKKNV